MFVGCAVVSDPIARNAELGCAPVVATGNSTELFDVEYQLEACRAVNNDRLCPCKAIADEAVDIGEECGETILDGDQQGDLATCQGWNYLPCTYMPSRW